MKRYKWLYMAAVAAAFTGYICTNRKQVLLLLIFLILVFVCSFCLWMITRNRLKLELEIVDVALVGHQIPVHIVLEYTGLMVANRVEVEVEYQNILFEQVVRQKIILEPGRSKRLEYVLPFASEHCGKTNVTMISAREYDMLGILSRKLPKAREKSIIINPRVAELKIHMDTLARAGSTGEYYDRMQKGQDATEVFDMRDYREGDSVRSIHWKLSGKLDKMIVREFGNPINYQTALYYDMYLDEKLPDEERETIQEAILQVTASIGSAMAKQNLPFHMITVNHAEREEQQVNDNASFLQMLMNMMSRSIPKSMEERNLQISLLNSDRRFTKIIYICGELNEAYLQSMSATGSVTVICLENQGQEAIESRQDDRIIKIPLDYLDGKMKAIEL